MAQRKVYSNNKDFLAGMAAGIHNADHDSAISVQAPKTSDHKCYAWMIVVDDPRLEQSDRHYYDGSVLGYREAAKA
jgi:hypothetical protein